MSITFARWTAGTLTAVSVIYLCAFKILDRDFWWHITAGRVMATTHRLITIEPFAHTRAGLPYTSNHEWLAQIALHLIHHTFGIAGIIAFRTGMVALVAFLLLMIDRGRLWPNAFFVIGALTLAQGGFMDRPQLFTFALLVAFLLTAFRALDSAEDNPRGAARLLLWYIPLELLWINAHGAAALLGVGIVGALIAQEFFDRHANTRRDKRYLHALCLIFGGLSLCLFVSPIGTGNITYLASLMSDRTIAFIAEWQPRPLADYAARYGALWIIVLAVMFAVRRKIIFSAIIIAAFGYLSRQAVRHEMLFAFAGTGIAIYQLRHTARWRRLIQTIIERPLAWISITVLVSLALGYTARTQYHALVSRDHLYGYGTFDLARGAYDFLERNNITGNMFNTYGIGGYLIYRGYPARQVYIDGRNIDYGFDFMARTYVAEEDPAAWQDLENRYGITYAVIDYDAIRKKDSYPFASHLEKNKNWTLAYLDDWAAVYLKHVPANRTALRKFGYAVLTPETLDNASFDVATLTPTQKKKLIAELLRTALNNTDGWKAYRGLAGLYMAKGNANLAIASIRTALQKQPYRPELHQALAEIYIIQEKWANAGRELEYAIHYAGNNFPNIDYDALADIFAKANNPPKENKYRKKANARRMKLIAPSQATASAADEQQKKDLLAQLAGVKEEAVAANNEGIEYAKAKNYAKAKESFLNAINLNIDYPEAFNNLANIYQEEKDFTQAIELYRKAIKKRTDYADAHYNLAIALLNTQQYVPALHEAELAAQLGHIDTALITKLKKLTK